MRASTTAPVKAPIGSRLSMLLEMNSVSVWVRPTIAPDTMATAPNSPRTRAVVSVMP